MGIKKIIMKEEVTANSIGRRMMEGTNPSLIWEQIMKGKKEDNKKGCIEVKLIATLNTERK